MLTFVPHRPTLGLLRVNIGQIHSPDKISLKAVAAMGHGVSFEITGTFDIVVVGADRDPGFDQGSRLSLNGANAARQADCK